MGRVPQPPQQVSRPILPEVHPFPSSGRQRANLPTSAETEANTGQLRTRRVCSTLYTELQSAFTVMEAASHSTTVETRSHPLIV